MTEDRNDQGPKWIVSGVTKVGVTRGGNWRCRLFFSSEKLTTVSYRPLQSDDFF